MDLGIVTKEYIKFKAYRVIMAFRISKFLNHFNILGSEFFYFFYLKAVSSGM